MKEGRGNFRKQYAGDWKGEETSTKLLLMPSYDVIAVAAFNFFFEGADT